MIRKHEEDDLSVCRRMIEDQYKDYPTGCGGSFGELLCYEIHENGLTFIWLAEKWGISLPTRGALIADHCNRLQPLPNVNHEYSPTGGGRDRQSGDCRSKI